MDRLDQDPPLAPAGLVGERSAVIPAFALDRKTGRENICHSVIEGALALPGAPHCIQSKPQPEEVYPALLFAVVFLTFQDGCLAALPDMGHGGVSCTEVIAKKEEDNPF